MMERALSDKRVLITEITTSANWCIHSRALAERHLAEVSQPSGSDQADSVFEAVSCLADAKWLSGCVAPTPYVWAEGREADVPWWPRLC